jgi:hypothetical protein
MERRFKMRSAFLVYFPKPQATNANQYGGAAQYGFVDPRPVLIVAMDIGDVASKNRSAIKIERIDCRNVLIDELIKEEIYSKEKKP